MRLRDRFGSDHEEGIYELGALGALLGVVLAVLVGPDGNPLLWAAVGGVVGLVAGLLAAELS